MKESTLFLLNLLTGIAARRRSLERGSVVECGSPLPLSPPTNVCQSARGLAHSKTFRAIEWFRKSPERKRMSYE